MAGPMTALLILPLMLHTATAVSDVEQVHLEISELCLKGPEYWCQSEQTASLCMKEEYCMELLQNAPAEALIGSGAGETAGSLKNPFGENKEWRRKDRFKKLRGGWGLKCKACKFVFKFLKNNVADDQSDGEIRSALDRVCQSVTFLLRFPCKWVIRKFKDAIIDAFEGHLDPATFCANVKMCSKQEETDMELSHLGDPKLCLQDSEYWCQSGETASLCMKEDYCMELWQNAPAELEASSHGGPEDATEEGKRKKNKKNKKGKQDKKGKKGKKNKRKEKTAVKCSGCTQIVTNLKNYVGGKLDDDTIKGAVDSMCDKVDDSIMKICTTIKEKNKDDLVAAVKNGGSPKDVCTQIQLCEGQELEESDGPHLPAPRVGPTCIFCQAFISFVKPLLTEKVQNKATGQVLAGFCMEHFGNSTTCNGFLSTYGTVVKQVLLKPWDQVITCWEIGACEAEISMSQSGVKRAASQHKSLEDTYSTQLLMVND
ncbi:pulmonary surfactant-associated protein B-like [Pleurodeles waltl]|uniref:pulmonary surfactant-associated protein B-like n=1 Tax=Pleurodeles waltl TaxID=8319 RepID=UPI00370984F4